MLATHDDVPQRAGGAARGMGAPGGSVLRVTFFTVALLSAADPLM